MGWFSRSVGWSISMSRWFSPSKRLFQDHLNIGLKCRNIENNGTRIIECMCSNLHERNRMKLRYTEFQSSSSSSLRHSHFHFHSSICSSSKYLGVVDNNAKTGPFVLMRI